MTRESILLAHVEVAKQIHGVEPVAVCLNSGGGVAYATFIVGHGGHGQTATLFGYDLSATHDGLTLEWELPATLLVKGTGDAVLLDDYSVDVYENDHTTTHSQWQQEDERAQYGVFVAYTEQSDEYVVYGIGAIR